MKGATYLGTFIVPKVPLGNFSNYWILLGPFPLLSDELISPTPPHCTLPAVMVQAFVQLFNIDLSLVGLKLCEGIDYAGLAILCTANNNAFLLQHESEAESVTLQGHPFHFGKIQASTTLKKSGDQLLFFSLSQRRHV
jgi:hypothetical protein